VYRISSYIIILLVFFSSSGQIFSQYYYNEFASFDGVNDYLSAPSHSELSLDSAFTIEAWVFVKDTSGFNKTILSTVSSANNTGFALLVKGSSSNPGSAGRLQFNINGTNNSVTQPNGTRLPLNRWSHIAVIFKDAGGNNSDSIRFYINGAQVLSLTRLVEPVSNSADSMRVGNCYLPGNYSNGLSGFVDDLRIYKTKRSLQQIANDRGVPVSMDGFTNVSFLSKSRYSLLTAAWTFDGNGNDNIGVKNNLSPVNGASFIPAKFNPTSYRNQSNYFIKFNGQSWLAAPDSTNTSYDTDTACTFEAYVYPDSAVSSNQTIISKGNNIKLGISSNKFYFSVNSGAKVLNTFSNVRLKAWTHIAATYRSVDGLMCIYLNGTLDSSKNFSPGNISTTNDSLLVGKSLTGEFLYGKLDEVRISRVAKSLIFIQRYLFTNIDNYNGSQFSPSLNSYGFEGNTLDNVSKIKPLLIRGDAHFEWINNGSGAGQSSQAPLLRTELFDYGNIGIDISQKSFSIRNNSANRDSIFIPPGFAGVLNSVSVILSHTYMDDVDISLRAPNGVIVNLSNDNGGTFNDMCVKFSNFHDSALSDVNAPFSMLIKPQSSFTPFAGINSEGYWRLTVTDDNAANVDSGRVYLWGLYFGPIPGISGNEIETGLKLYQNYPNPFNPNTVISYQLAVSGFISLKVYDILGNEVKTLVNQNQREGSYEVEFEGSSLSSGMYFYKLETEDFNEVKKMILIK